MKLFNSKAFALTALTITVAAANIAPSLAEDLPALTGTNASPHTVMPAAISRPGSISMLNRGAYVARYKLSYNLNSNTKTVDSGDVTVGKKISFHIPLGANNIQLVGEVYTGVFNQKKSFFVQRFSRLNSHISFTTSGTVFNPQVNRN